ncbi:MAG: LysE family translocator [Deltaproteobacteria bacterium]|nr:LysE family translocator [Deltaproteobacteria bacterium]
MIGIQNFPLFLISCIMLNLTPGQDTIYIIGRSVAQGKKSGILSAMGIMSGVLIHTFFAAIGLSVILATSSLAFAIVKYAGAGYLIWIGIGFLRNRRPDEKTEIMEKKQLGPWKIYRQGILTNLLNPKVALFFLSFLPQFVDPRTEVIFIPFMALGLVFFITGSLWCMVLVYGASWLADRVRHQSFMGGILKKVTGTLFIGLGIKLAISHAE